MLATTRFCLYQGSFHIFYYYWVKNFICDTEDFIIYHLHVLTESEVIITGKSQTKALMVNIYIKAEVWDLPVMTEWTRLINYSLYGFFRAMNTIKKHRKKFSASLRKRSFQVMFTELKCIWRFNQNHKTQFPLTMRNVDPNWYTCISALPTFFVFSLLF